MASVKNFPTAEEWVDFCTRDAEDILRRGGLSSSVRNTLKLRMDSLPRRLKAVLEIPKSTVIGLLNNTRVRRCYPNTCCRRFGEEAGHQGLALASHSWAVEAVGDCRSRRCCKILQRNVWEGWRASQAVKMAFYSSREAAHSTIEEDLKGMALD
jgi:hypothetical protein